MPSLQFTKCWWTRNSHTLLHSDRGVHEVRVQCDAFKWTLQFIATRHHLIGFQQNLPAGVEYFLHSGYQAIRSFCSIAVARWTTRYMISTQFTTIRNNLGSIYGRFLECPKNIGTTTGKIGRERAKSKNKLYAPLLKQSEKCITKQDFSVAMFHATCSCWQA